VTVTQREIDALSERCLGMTNEVQANTCANELALLRQQQDAGTDEHLIVLGVVLGCGALLLFLAIIFTGVEDIRRRWWAWRDESTKREQDLAQRDGCEKCGRPPLQEPA
jgi:hypothetical protein